RDYREIAVFERPRIDVDVFGLPVTNGFDPFRDVVVSDIRLVIVDRKVLILTEFELRGDFELGGELKRLPLIEFDFGDIGPANNVKLFLLNPLLQMPRDQVFEHLLTDITLELLTNQAGRSLAGPKTRQFGLLLERGDHLPGFRLHLFYGH